MGKASSESSERSQKTLIIVPRIDATGPSKGAVALLNGLNRQGYEAEILPLRSCSGEIALSAQRDVLIKAPSLFQKAKALRKYVKASSSQVSLVSSCFSADLTVLLSGLAGQSICSIRGNLKENYRMDYGEKGRMLALAHHLIASRFSVVTALNTTMANTLRAYSNCVRVVPNFIDEPPLLRPLADGGPVRFVFVGSLSKRKAILELLEVFRDLKVKGLFFNLDILGDGPLSDQVSEALERYNLSAEVTLHGQVEDIMSYLVRSDYFVLPSYSEGTSRAAMEALYAGLPCIMRDVDSNFELILGARQGELFQSEQELSEIIEECVRAPKPRNDNLLPEPFRQDACSETYGQLCARVGR